MRDEELADKYAEEWVKENMDCCKTDNSVNQPIPYFDEEERCCAKSACIDGFLAGLKAGRPQWHDLRKDPNDLPKDTVSVLISRGTPRTSRARYNGKWYGYYSDDEIEDVIAWCEIPTFDKE